MNTELLEIPTIPIVYLLTVIAIIVIASLCQDSDNVRRLENDKKNRRGYEH